MRCLRWLWFLVLALAAGCGQASARRVVVYCALDREFAEPILERFKQTSGLNVVVRWDTEANKSVGLYEDLLREADQPRCDVHWNNEILATIRLQKNGLLLPYASPAATPFPEQFKARDHTWTAFAARARVFLINKQRLPDPATWPKSLEEVARRGDLSFTLAKPQFGTTASHVACLLQAWGADRTRDLLESLQRRGVTLMPGNKQVAVAVGQGKFAIGLTDTDDALAEVEQGKPVAVVFPEPALFLPNTVAIIKNGPNPEGAKKLVDYLLSPEVEKRLAESAGRQIPLNPEVKANLPAEIRTPAQLQLLHADFEKAADLWSPAQKLAARAFGL